MPQKAQHLTSMLLLRLRCLASPSMAKAFQLLLAAVPYPPIWLTPSHGACPMPDKTYPSPSSKRTPARESGFGLVEVMVSLAILMIAAAGIGYVLVSTNQQLTTTEYALQNQQYGMQATLVGATGSTTSVGVGIQPQPQTVNVTITTAPPVQPQGCTSMMSMMLNMMLCFFGSCSGTASPSASSVVVQVPTASLSSSFAALPNNQQPPAWWQP